MQARQGYRAQCGSGILRAADNLHGTLPLCRSCLSESQCFVSLSHGKGGWNMTRLSAPSTNERVNPSNAAFGQTWPTSCLLCAETVCLCKASVLCILTVFFFLSAFLLSCEHFVGFVEIYWLSTCFDLWIEMQTDVWIILRDLKHMELIAVLFWRLCLF